MAKKIAMWIRLMDYALRLYLKDNRYYKFTIIDAKKAGLKGLRKDTVQKLVKDGYLKKHTVQYSITPLGLSLLGYDKSGRKFKSNTKSMTYNAKIVGRIGDVNPIDYGGGVVFKKKSYEPFVEYTLGLEMEGETESRMTVYQVVVELDVFSYHDWADIKDIAISTGVDPEDLEKAGRSRKTMDRVWAIEEIAGYYGWYELDQYPITLSASQLEKRWKL